MRRTDFESYMPHVLIQYALNAIEKVATSADGMVAGVRKDAYYAPVAVMHGFGSTKEKGHRPRVPFKEQNVTDRLKFCLSRWSRLCLLGPSVVATIDCGSQVQQMYHPTCARPIGVRPRIALIWCVDATARSRGGAPAFVRRSKRWAGRHSA